MASSRAVCSIQLHWDTVIPIGPKLAFHTGCIINNTLYIHGGIRSHGSTEPSSKLYRLDMTERIWMEIKTTGSPALSHHAAVPSNDRYLLLIGGWTGHIRSGKIFAYDTRKDEWICPKQSGFPDDAGLSSHTATQMGKGDILILGREGSLRIQRRYGNAYLVQGSVETGFKFLEYSRSVASRSGHTASIVGTKMYILGGRKDRLLEFQTGISSGNLNTVPRLEKLANMTRNMSPMEKLPGGRKHHVAISGGGVILIHGGETFDGRREPVGDMFLVTTKTTVDFIKLGETQVKRAGHICFPYGDDVFIHGGLTGKSSVCGDVLSLVVE